MNNKTTATLCAGIPLTNPTLYHRIRFLVGDPAAFIVLPANGGEARVLILRDIEMDRARVHASADRVSCPADWSPVGGLSGDRETATAQAVAECLRQHEVTHVVADRTLPLIFAHYIQQLGIDVTCDTELGVMERRRKDEQEIEWMRAAQEVTENVMQEACRLVAQAESAKDGSLIHDGKPLTSERVRFAIDVWLLEYEQVCSRELLHGGF